MKITLFPYNSALKIAMVKAGKKNIDDVGECDIDFLPCDIFGRTEEAHYSKDYEAYLTNEKGWAVHPLFVSYVSQ